MVQERGGNSMVQERAQKGFALLLGQQTGKPSTNILDGNDDDQMDCKKEARLASSLGHFDHQELHSKMEVYGVDELHSKKEVYGVEPPRRFLTKTDGVRLQNCHPPSFQWR